MKTIKMNVYQFHELSERAKEKARQWYIEGMWQWYEPTIWDQKDYLRELGVENPEIYFSGFGSQGDGACFDGTIRDYAKFLGRELRNGEEFILEYSGSRIFSKGRYSHERSREFELCFDCPNFAYGQNEELSAIASDLENEIEEKRIDLCCKIYKELEQEYEYQTSDNAIAEMLEDRFFFENGEVAEC